MSWKLHSQQQQRGAQMPSSGGANAGKAPDEATRDRAAQDHEHAGGTPRPGNYPASRIEDRDGDITPSAPEPDVDWDEVVQPEPAKARDVDPQPIPEGK